jgi:hypothetical protein
MGWISWSRNQRSDQAQALGLDKNSALFYPVFGRQVGTPSYNPEPLKRSRGGMGVAPMTISPFARWLISTYDWRIAMLTIGILAWTLLCPPRCWFAGLAQN